MGNQIFSGTYNGTDIVFTLDDIRQTSGHLFVNNPQNADDRHAKRLPGKINLNAVAIKKGDRNELLLFFKKKKKQRRSSAPFEKKI